MAVLRMQFPWDEFLHNGAHHPRMLPVGKKKSLILKNFNILQNRTHYNYFMLKNPGFHLFTINVHLKRLKSFCIELIAIRKAFFKDKKLDWNVIERISHVLWWYKSFLFIQLLKTHNKSLMILASNTWSLYFFFL